MKVVKIYAKVGFCVSNVLMDGKIDKVKPYISLVEIKISAAREHVT